MAIITKYTLGKLCAELEITFNVTQEDFVKQVIVDNEIYFMLNSRENKYLFVYSSMLENEEDFKEKFYKEVPEKEDAKVFVNEKGGKSNYHLYHDCIMLKKDFSDFYIPDDIRNIDIENKNDNAVTEYRNWFKENDFSKKFESGNITLETIVFRYNSKYPKMYGINPLQENFNLYQKIPNTGNSFVDDNFDVNTFYIELENIKKEFDTTFHSPELRRFSKFSRIKDEPDTSLISILNDSFPDTNFTSRWSIDKIRSLLVVAARLKKNMISLLVEYLRWHHHFKTKEFDTITLETFGLKCCNYCNKRKNDEALIV